MAARTAATVADALAIFNTFMAAYSPVISIQITALADPKRSFIALEFLLDEATSSPQTLELALGVSLGVFRLLMGDHYRPLAVHLPHDPLTPPADYIQYFGCTPYFAERRAGFTVRTADLSLPLNRDDIAHRAVVDYLSSITPLGAGMVESVRTIVRQLLPTGAATLDVVAEQFHLHPKTLQRRLAEKNTTFAGLVDQVRKDAADRYLRTTGISLSHLARELLRRAERAHPLLQEMVRDRADRLPQPDPAARHQRPSARSSSFSDVSRWLSTRCKCGTPRRHPTSPKSRLSAVLVSVMFIACPLSTNDIG